MTSALESYLDAHRLCVDELVICIVEKIPTLRGVLLIAVGSVIERLGNSSSDLDIFAICDDVSATRYSGPGISFSVGTAVLDIEVISTATISSAIDAVSHSVDSQDIGDSVLIPYRTLLMLHRLLSGVPLNCESKWKAIRARVSAEHLLHVLKNRACVDVETAHQDLLGMLEAPGQSDVALLRAADIVSALCSGVLAALGATNPNLKWRLALMRVSAFRGWDAELPGGELGCDCDQFFFALLTFRDLPAGPSGSRDFCLSCILLSNRILPWVMGIRMPRRSGNERDSHLGVGQRKTGRRLRPEFFMRAEGSAIEIASVRTQTKFLVGLPVYECLLMMDTQIPHSEAILRLDAHGLSAEAAENLVDNTRAFADFSGLSTAEQVAAAP